MTKFKAFVIIFTILTCLAAGLVSLSKGQGFFGWFTFLVNQDTQPLLFIALMVLMPIIGFPFSIFLVLAGIKFGIAWGYTLTSLTMAVHLTCSYLLGHSIFKPYLDQIMMKYRMQLSDLREKTSLFHLILFALIPGCPYAVKNYTLSLSGLSFPAYFAVGWTTQLIMALPFVAFGRHAAKMNLRWAFFLLVFLIVLYLFLHWLYRRLSGKEESLKS